MRHDDDDDDEVSISLSPRIIINIVEIWLSDEGHTHDWRHPQRIVGVALNWQSKNGNILLTYVSAYGHATYIELCYLRCFKL